MAKNNIRELTLTKISLMRPAKNEIESVTNS